MLELVRIILFLILMVIYIAMVYYIFVSETGKTKHPKLTLLLGQFFDPYFALFTRFLSPSLAHMIAATIYAFLIVPNLASGVYHVLKLIS